jgi:molybdopterin-synthase adenylyltransferase
VPRRTAPTTIQEQQFFPIVPESNSSANRYARQEQFKPVGKQGQQRIALSRVTVLGCGALGTVAAEILARAGVGHIRLVDRDVVEWTNLQRQSLFDEADAIQARSKAEAAAERLVQINSSINIEPVVVDVTSDNIATVLENCDLVIDAVDNFSLRFLLNDWALETKTAWVHGGCVGASGQVRLFTGNGKPCFRCLVPEPPPAAVVATCDTAGVLGGATHAIASLQSLEAIKWLSGNTQSIRSRVLSIDFWSNRIREIDFDNQLIENCKACQGELEFLRGPLGRTGTTAVMCGRDTVQFHSSQPNLAVNFDAFAGRWNTVGKVQVTRFFVRLHVDEATQLTLFRDGRVLVSGTSDTAKARSIYDRYVGN